MFLAAFGPPALFALSIARAKRYRKEPGHALVKAFIWGAIPAAFLALFVNTLVAGEITRPYLQDEGSRRLALALVIAPFTEEFTKMIGIVAVASVRRHTDEVVDGIIYGAVIGLGFSATENLFYELQAMASGQAFLTTTVARTFSSSLLHMTASAVAGYGIGRWLSGRSRLGSFIVIPWYVLAVVLHSAFNAVALAAVAFTILPLMGLGVWAFFKVRRRVIELSLVAPHHDWTPVGQTRSFEGDDDATLEPRRWKRIDPPEEDPSRDHGPFRR